MLPVAGRAGVTRVLGAEVWRLCWPRKAADLFSLGIASCSPEIGVAGLDSDAIEVIVLALRPPGKTTKSESATDAVLLGCAMNSRGKPSTLFS